MKKKILSYVLAVGTLLSSCIALTGCKNNKNDDSSDSNTYPWAEGRTFVESKTVGELTKTNTVRIHYVRPDAEYADWDVWSWQNMPESLAGAAYSFSMYDTYGVVADVAITTQTKIGVIVRKGGDEWKEKDVEKDRFIDVQEKSNAGIQDVYVLQGREEIFTDPDEMLQPAILSSYANILRNGTHSAIVTLSKPIKQSDVSSLKVYEGNNEIQPANKLFIDERNIRIDFSTDFKYDFTKSYSVSFDFGDNQLIKRDLSLVKLYSTSYFESLYAYDGDDLGVTFNEDKSSTTFKLWAPVSTSVKVNIYNSGTKSSDNKPVQTIDMVKGEKGVWSSTVNSYLHGKYYTYEVTNGTTKNEVVDPYAKSCGLNGQIGMVVDFDKINEELEWDKVNRPVNENVKNNVDTSIYEIHVRDMTIDSTSGVSSANRGKFLGLSEKGTKYKGVSTGLDHIKELGVTHVQIQPFYDYNSVDESSNNGYNWGYDPLNYNCLEGSYSTDPSDGFNRIKEFKTMVKAMLEEGIQVNMDVVYNHTASNDDTNFEKIIPGYYHRLNANLDYSNGSGCGNEMATENYMYRKFVVDSCKFWLGEYKLSGFRFDLMGLIDTTTMSEVYEECSKIYDQVMVYGEPWTGGTTTLQSKLQTNQQTIGDLEAIVGAFNDQIRNAVKGDNNPSAGWVQGDTSSGNVLKIKAGIVGSFSSGLSKNNIDPNKVINYVSCHDNYTLFDQLNKTMPKDRNLTDAYKQSEAIIFTSQGIPFIQEGEDFLRTKSAGTGDQVHNSYNAGDKVNKMDYSLKANNIEMFNYFKKLIQFRKDHKAFRLGTSDLINSNVSFIETGSTSLIAYKVNYEGKTYIVAHASKEGSLNLGGSYKVIFDKNGDSSTNTISSITLGVNESVVLESI